MFGSINEAMTGRAFLYGALALLFGAFYVLINIAWRNWLPLPQAQMATALVAGLVTALTCDRLEAWLRRLAIRYLYGRRYDPEQVLAKFNRGLTRLIEPQEIIAYLLEMTRQTLAAVKADYYSLDLTGQKYVSAGGDYRGLDFILTHPLVTELGSRRRPLSQRSCGRSVKKADQLMAADMSRSDLSLVVPLFNQENLVAFLAMGRRISGRDYSRFDISFLGSMLKQASLALTNAYFYAQAKDHEKQASLGELSASMAHEIKNSLNAFLLFAKLLQMQEDNLAVVKEVAEIMPAEIRRLDKTLENLLNFAGQKPLEMRSIDVNQVIEAAWELLRKQAENEHVVMESNLGDIPEIMADPDQVQQVIINLVINAIQAMAGTGGRITLTTAPLEPRSPGGRSEAPLDRIVITVADTGPGIAEKDMNKLFNRFFTTKKGGTGLGLATSYRIVTEKHHGKIQVESRVGQGTTFKIILPVKQPDSKASS